MPLSLKSLFLLFIIVLASCAGSPRAVNEKEPDWLFHPPGDKGFYYGIGNSNSGHESKDRSAALIRAKGALAASISQDILSDLEMKNSEIAEESDENGKKLLENRIKQSVEQSLMNVQIWESWYHPKRGYWVLVRIGKDDWHTRQVADRRVSIPVPQGLTESTGFNIPFVAALSGMNLPLQLLPGGKNTPFELSLEWVVSDLPLSEDLGEIYFSELKGIVSFKQYGILRFSREYGPIKESGLSYEQSHERGAVRILKEFQEDEDFSRDLKDVLQAESSVGTSSVDSLEEIDVRRLRS